MGIDFALIAFNYFDRNDPNKHFIKLSDSVQTLILNTYNIIDITEVFIVYLPYFKNFSLKFIITEGCLNRSVIIECADSNFYRLNLGLQICYYYDIEPATHIIEHHIVSGDIKSLRYAYLLICKYNIIELENESI